MLTTANEEEEADESAAEPAQAPVEDPAEAYARYMRISGFRADDTIWHQRLGHPSRVTLKNCIEAGVFAPGALLRLDDTKVRGATHPRNCTICLEAAVSHQSFPLLEPGTNRYAKLEKVYSDFLNVGHFGINDEMYTLTFVDAGTCYVWIVNVEVRSRAYKVFRLWLAHAQQQSGEKLKIWQSDSAAEFRSKEMQDYLAQKGIKHHVSLHGLLSTTAITGNSSPHVKWMGTKGNTSMLRVRAAKLHLRTKLQQPFRSRNLEASSQEAIAATTMTTKTTILLEEEQAHQADAEAEAAEAQHCQHHLNQNATMTMCRKSSHSTATTAPLRDFNSSGSTLPPQRRHVSSSRRIRAKHSRDHTARNGAR
ncbi:unnamed protein product [Closterium sp. NIES-54]